MRLPQLLAALPALLLTATPALAQEPAPTFNPRVLGTRSIVACDAATKACGLAIISFPAGVGPLVAYGRPGVAVATQLYPSVDVAEAVVARVGAGEAPQEALDAAVAADPGRDFRQLGVAALGPDGSVRLGQYVGSFPWPQQCALKGATYVVQASAQTSAEVCRAMAEGFERATGSFPFRLMAALKAGAKVGGDVRGERSGIVRVWSGVSAFSGFSHVVADSQVMGSATALEELERKLDLYVGQLVPADTADQVVLDAPTTRAVQHALRELNYYRGPAHGRWTDEVEAALGAFQVNNIVFLKPTVVEGGVRKADGPLLRMLVNAEPGTLFPAPR